MTLGKGFGSGFPVSGVLTKTDIAETPPWNQPSGASSSYGGNRLGPLRPWRPSASSKAERLWENAETVGRFMLGRLRRMHDGFPSSARSGARGFC